MRNLYTFDADLPAEIDHLGLTNAPDRAFVRYLYLCEGPRIFWSRVADAVGGTDDDLSQIQQLRSALQLEWITLAPWIGDKPPNLSRTAQALIRRWMQLRPPNP